MGQYFGRPPEPVRTSVRGECAKRSYEHRKPIRVVPLLDVEFSEPKTPDKIWSTRSAISPGYYP